MRTTALFAFVLVTSGGCGTNSAPPVTQSDSAPARESSAQAPFVQGSTQEDIGIREQIREKLVASDLSAEAQNVSVVTQHGKVLLSGSVRTKVEKARVVDFAEEVAGADNVASELEVLPGVSNEKEFTIRLE